MCRRTGSEMGNEDGNTRKRMPDICASIIIITQKMFVHFFRNYCRTKYGKHHKKGVVVDIFCVCKDFSKL